MPLMDLTEAEAARVLRSRRKYDPEVVAAKAALARKLLTPEQLAKADKIAALSAEERRVFHAALGRKRNEAFLARPGNDAILRDLELQFPDLLAARVGGVGA